MKHLLLSLLLLPMLACSGPATLPDSSVFPPVPPSMARMLNIENDRREQLIDPASGIFSTPILLGKYKSWRGLINGGGYDYGYLFSYTVNAKNVYGGYTGRETVYMLVTKDELFEIIGGPVKSNFIIETEK